MTPKRADRRLTSDKRAVMTHIDHAWGEDKITAVVSAYQRAFPGTEAERENNLVLRDIANRGHVAHPSLDPDPHVTAFNCGKTRLALDTFLMLSITEDDIRMYKEGKKDDGNKSGYRDGRDPTGGRRRSGR